MTLIMVDAARVSVAKILAARSAFLAVGGGDAGWGATPASPATNTAALTDPIALVRASAVSYVVADAGGAIVQDDGSKWTVSGTPTADLLLQFVLDFADGAGETLREAALYLDATLAGGVPGGQTYIDWSDVTDPGALLGVERFAPISRAGLRLEFQRVISL